MRIRQSQCRHALVSMLLVICAVWACGSATAQVQPADDEQAREIVRKADQIRFPAEGFETEVTIRSTRDGKETDARRFKVLSKGNDSTITMVTEPASDRGQMMLMKGRDLWVFMPDVSQPVRLALSQRLTGQVANGDLARANFAGDYAAKLTGTEVLDGEPHMVLELTAVDRSVTYAKVVYWVRKSNGWPSKAEFYSLSNRLLKVCHYEAFKELGGRVRPTRLVLKDAIRDGEVSVMEYSRMKLRELPDKIFTKEYLKKLD